MIDINDFEFTQIIDDYEAYCIHDGLIDGSSNWMRAVPCGWALEDNFKYSLYYDPADRGYSDHSYIGIYHNKSIRGIGKIINIVTADFVKDDKIIENESRVTNEQKENIVKTIKSSIQNWPSWTVYKGHKFFIVDKFHETDFKKGTKYPLQGTKFFNLKELLNVEKLPEVQDIADKLKAFSW